MKEIITLESIESHDIFSGDALDDAIEKAKFVAQNFIDNYPPLTPDGIKEIKRQSRLFSSLKVRVENCGKDLISEKKKEVNDFNKRLRLWREEIDLLRDAVRTPVTDLEERSRLIQSAYEEMSQIGPLNLQTGIPLEVDDIEEMKKRLSWISKIDDDAIADKLKQAILKCDSFISRRIEALKEEKKIESERVELEELRREKIERERIEKEKIDREKLEAEYENKIKEFEEIRVKKLEENEIKEIKIKAIEKAKKDVKDFSEDEILSEVKIICEKNYDFGPIVIYQQIQSLLNTAWGRI